MCHAINIGHTLIPVLLHVGSIFRLLRVFLVTVGVFLDRWFGGQGSSSFIVFTPEAFVVLLDTGYASISTKVSVEILCPVDGGIRKGVWSTDLDSSQLVLMIRSLLFTGFFFLLLMVCIFPVNLFYYRNWKIIAEWSGRVKCLATGLSVQWWLMCDRCPVKRMQSVFSVSPMYRMAHSGNLVRQTTLLVWQSAVMYLAQTMEVMHPRSGSTVYNIHNNI